jgi:hypothetical protein
MSIFYTSSELYSIIDGAVDKNTVVFDNKSEEGELSMRFLALLRQVYREQYFKYPKRILIDQDYEDDIKFLAYQTQLLPIEYELTPKVILGFNISYIPDLNKTIEQYKKDHLNICLRVYGKTKVIIVTNEYETTCLLGVY